MDFSAFAAGIARLTRSIDALASYAAPLGVASLAGREWFNLLYCKLLPQVEGPPLLIVAIVGGTNIGKSVVFNHLAGETASAATPLAAGTKHPVCLVPRGCDDPALLQGLFEQFRLHAWQSPDDPLSDAEEDRIYWRVGPNVPPRLVLLDAPDVDSDVTVNWQRSRAVRQTADVLIALLTQQKYNDAAVKQFFRAAVEADKPTIAIFNFCDLQADRAYWPQWLARFRAETGADPDLVYVVPYDRTAAEELRLPFYRCYPDGRAEGASLGVDFAAVANSPSAANEQPPPAARPEFVSSVAYSPADLRNELAALHFDAIKIRTFRGALGCVLDPADGLPAYLQEIRAAALQFAAAASALSATEMARVAWPNLPSSVLVDEMQQWWDAGRSDWSRRIHGVYRAVGRGVMRPIRTAWTAVAGPQEDPLAAFVRQEHSAVIGAVERLLDELQRLSDVGSAILQPRLKRILSGQARAELLARIQGAHQALPPVDDDYRAMLRSELDAMKAAFPRTTRWLQTFDQTMALARPALTVTLAVSGWVFAGDVVGQAAMHMVGQVAGHVASEVVVAGGGEAIVAGGGEGLRQAAARLLGRLQLRFAQKRAQWLADFLEDQLLGDLLAELRQGAAVAESIEFKEVEAAMAALKI